MITDTPNVVARLRADRRVGPATRDPSTCSHDWRDVEHVGRLVLNRPVAPVVAHVGTDPERRYMHRGRSYVCLNCHRVITIAATGTAAVDHPGGPGRAATDAAH